MNLVGPARPSSPVAADEPVAVVERAANELVVPWPTGGSRRVGGGPDQPAMLVGSPWCSTRTTWWPRGIPIADKRTYWLVERS
jgi:hypothetical protein